MSERVESPEKHGSAMSAKWECEKCLFDNEAVISFCQLCGHHAAVDLLRLHVVDKDAEIAELTRVREGYSPDEAVVQKAYQVREQLMDIIAAAELEERKQRQKDEEDKKKQLEEDGRPWPSLEETVGSLIDSVSAGIDGTLPTFTYSWSSKEDGEGEATTTGSSSSGNSPAFAVGAAAESKLSDIADTKHAPGSAGSIAGGGTAQLLKNEKGERLTFPQMSDGTVVKRITSYNDKAAIRRMLRFVSPLRRGGGVGGGTCVRVDVKWQHFARFLLFFFFLLFGAFAHSGVYVAAALTVGLCTF